MAGKNAMCEDFWLIFGISQHGIPGAENRQDARAHATENRQDSCAHVSENRKGSRDQTGC